MKASLVEPGVFSLYARGHEPMLFKSSAWWALLAVVEAYPVAQQRAACNLTPIDQAGPGVVPEGGAMTVEDSCECECGIQLAHLVPIDATVTQGGQQVRARLHLGKECLFVTRLHKLGPAKLIFRFPLSTLAVALGAEQGSLALTYGNRYLAVRVANPSAVQEVIEAFCHAYGGWKEWGVGRGRGQRRGPVEVPWGAVCCAPEQDMAEAKQVWAVELLTHGGGEPEPRHFVYLAESRWLLLLAPHTRSLGWAHVEWSYPLRALAKVEQDPQRPQRLRLVFQRPPPEQAAAEGDASVPGEGRLSMSYTVAMTNAEVASAAAAVLRTAVADVEAITAHVAEQE